LYLNKATVTLTFRENTQFGLKFLADKYADGCCEKFLMEFILHKIAEEFADDLQVDNVKDTIERLES